MKRLATALFVTMLTLGINPDGTAGQGPAAVVDGVRIEPWEVEREFQNLLPQTSFHRRVEGERRAALERRALDTVVMKELKRQWAVKEELPVDTAVIDREMMEIQGRFPDSTAYQRALTERGMSEAGLRRAIERDHLAEAVDEHILSAVAEPTSDEVEHFFAVNRAEYVTPESRHVIHVLVYVAPSAGTAAWERAAEEAATVAASARDGATDLGEEAIRRRTDIPPRYRDQTGDLGMVHRGALQPDVEKAVFSALPGDVVGPIRTIYGYSVLQVISVEPPRPIELKQVRDAVFSSLLSDRRETALAGFESRLQAAVAVDWGSSSVEH